MSAVRKRKLGQRDLWDVIVNNDDICFEHILPRLNPSDVKFLNDPRQRALPRVPTSQQKKSMSEARIELAIFGFVDRRNIHYATRPCD